jgi:hypothetical protein
MNLNTVRRVLEEGYEDRGVFEPEEKFWQAVKQVIDMLGRKDRQRVSKNSRTQSISKRDNAKT